MKRNEIFKKRMTEKSASQIDKIEVKENGFIFENHLGVNIKIAIHDEFNDDNLESTLMTNMGFDFKRRSTLKRNVNFIPSYS